MNEELLAFVQPYMRHDKDNWSPEVQIAILSFEVIQLQEHLANHSKDVDAKRSLLKKVARRRKFLKYLKEKDISRYSVISKKLKIKV